LVKIGKEKIVVRFKERSKSSTKLYQVPKFKQRDMFDQKLSYNVRLNREKTIVKVDEGVGYGHLARTSIPEKKNKYEFIVLSKSTNIDIGVTSPELRRTWSLDLNSGRLSWVNGQSKDYLLKRVNQGD
jgi:hypothetical protein